MAPVIRILGPATLEGVTGKRPQAPELTRDLVVFLALHPSDSHEMLDQALWPDARIRTGYRCKVMNQARTWLGTTAGGQPYVSLVQDQGYRLHPDAVLDWHQFLALAPYPPAASTAQLTSALQLVRGRPLVNVNPVRYAWADVDVQLAIAAIADTAHELTTRALRSRQPRIANWASAIGTTIEPANEQLWRDRLLAAHASAQPHQVDDTVQRLKATVAHLGPLEDETISLIDKLTHDLKLDTAAFADAVNKKESRS